MHHIKQVFCFTADVQPFYSHTRRVQGEQSQKMRNWIVWHKMDRHKCVRPLTVCHESEFYGTLLVKLVRKTVQRFIASCTTAGRTVWLLWCSLAHCNAFEQSVCWLGRLSSKQFTLLHRWVHSIETRPRQTLVLSTVLKTHAVRLVQSRP